MHIALYFGSFNPIHNGHIGLANYLLEEHLAQEIWFVLSPQNPLKESSTLLNDAKRLEMTRHALEAYPHIKLSDIEFSMHKPNYTINTLNRLQELHPQHRFTLLIGADNMEIFDKWKDYAEILSHFSVMVYPRTGYPFNAAKYPQMQLVQAPLFDVSSTQVRDAIKAGRPYGQWVPEPVSTYIEQHGLYK